MSQINSLEWLFNTKYWLDILIWTTKCKCSWQAPLGTLSFSINDNPNLISIQALGNIADNFALDTMYIADNPLLETLEGLEWINEGLDLFIFNNDSLTNLSGVGSIESLEVLIVRDCDNFTNFEGLSENLTIFSDLIIDNNDSLEQLTGLEDIDISGIIDIRNNDNLLNINLNGLGASTGEATSLYLENNLILNDISQINPIAISSEFNELSIINNPSLSTCNTAFICNLLAENYDPNSFSFFITLENNGEDCNDVNNLLINCETVPINDDCQDAQQINISETVQSYNQFGSTSTQTPTCNNDGDIIDVWFRFNSGDLSTLDISVDSGFNLQLWEGDCNTLTAVVNACAESVLNDVLVEFETDYFLQVWSDDNSLERQEAGLFSLNVQDGTLSEASFAIENFEFYPNPVNTNLSFKSAKPVDHLELFNSLGQSILNLNPKATVGVLKFDDLDSGLYFLKVSIDGKQKVIKVLKNKE